MKNKYTFLIRNLKPAISEEDSRCLQAYHNFFKDKQKELHKWLIKELVNHHDFGNLIRSLSNEALEMQNKYSQQLQYNAIFKDEWDDFITYQIQQGITYAQMDINFYSWYDVVSLARNWMVPKLVKETKDEADLLAVLGGMNRFFDISMSIIAESYLNEKQSIIENQKKEQEKINERLHQAMLAMEQKNQELEQFAYIASHDLQEPLRTVSSFIHLLKKKYMDELDEKANMYLNQISNSSERMVALINGLLEYSRLGNQKERGRVDCNALISDLLLDLDQMIKETQAIISINEMPELEVYPAQFKLLFQNLITNAIKFRQPDLDPCLHISTTDKEDHWEFCFSDNGIGIKKEYFEKIFIIFQRLHTQREYQGSGIGLSHCKKIIELHQGKIWVESQVGKGSKFYFTIPKSIDHEKAT